MPLNCIAATMQALQHYKLIVWFCLVTSFVFIMVFTRLTYRSHPVARGWRGKPKTVPSGWRGWPEIV